MELFFPGAMIAEGDPARPVTGFRPLWKREVFPQYVTTDLVQCSVQAEKGKGYMSARIFWKRDYSVIVTRTPRRAKIGKVYDRLLGPGDDPRSATAWLGSKSLNPSSNRHARHTM